VTNKERQAHFRHEFYVIGGQAQTKTEAGRDLIKITSCGLFDA
jgi:hypothetical protein